MFPKTDQLISSQHNMCTLLPTDICKSYVLQRLLGLSTFFLWEREGGLQKWLPFSDVCIQIEGYTYDAVTNEPWEEVPSNNKYPLFPPSELCGLPSVAAFFLPHHLLSLFPITHPLLLLLFLLLQLSRDSHLRSAIFYYATLWCLSSTTGLTSLHSFMKCDRKLHTHIQALPQDYLPCYAQQGLPSQKLWTSNWIATSVISSFYIAFKPHMGTMIQPNCWVGSTDEYPHTMPITRQGCRQGEGGNWGAGAPPFRFILSV